MMWTGANPTRNGHADDAIEAELDQLVADELAAAAPPRIEEPIEQALARVAARLRKHPDREALLERLHRETLNAPVQAPNGEADGGRLQRNNAPCSKICSRVGVSSAILPTTAMQH